MPCVFLAVRAGPIAAYVARLLYASARRSCRCGLGALAWLALAPGAWAASPGQAAQQSQSGVCREAARTAETSLRVPDAFLSAIAKVESGRPDPVTGVLGPWPWTVNAEGRGSFYASKAEAIAAVQALQARGVRSIDVGCLQVNLLQHAGAFASLEQAFDPLTNAQYAAGFLVSLFQQTGSWPLAAAAYHSQTPTIGAPYERRVLAEWATPDTAPDPMRPRHHGRPPAAARLAAAEDAPEDAHMPAPGEAARPTVHDAAPASPIAPIGRPPVMGEVAFPGAHGGGPVGRSLAAYRQLPVRLAMRPLHPPF